LGKKASGRDYYDEEKQNLFHIPVLGKPLFVSGFKTRTAMDVISANETKGENDATK
jgi:hypothetical protein